MAEEAAPTLDSVFAPAGAPAPAAAPTPPSMGDLFARSVQPTMADLFDQGPPSTGSATADAARSVLNPTENLSPYAKDMASAAFRPVKALGSLVGTLTSPLAYPARLEAAAVIKAASLLGVPKGRELEQTLNPGHRWLPDAYISDVMDFYDDGSPWSQDVRNAASSTKMLYYGGRSLVGLAANVAADPWNLFAGNTYTKAAEGLRKVGNEIDAATELPNIVNPAAHEKNLLSLRVPFSGGKEIPLVPMSAAQPGIDLLKKVPGVDTLAGLLRTMSPDTGFPDVDLASSSHAALGRGESESVLSAAVRPNNAMKFTQAENDLIATLVEKTPNVRPNLPESVIKAAKGKLSGDEVSIRGQMRTILKEADVDPARAEQMVGSAMTVKSLGGLWLESQYRAGFLDETNAYERILENHLPHVVEPAYRGMKLKGKDPESLADEVLSRQKALENQSHQAIKGSYLSSTDPVRYRSMSRGLTLPESNAKVLQEYGVKDFFVTDPVRASSIRLLEAQKLERDKNLLDTISRYGQRLKPGQKPPEGFAMIDHPNFNSKTILIKDGAETKKIFLRDTVFPKEIASKMSYYLNPPAVTGLKAQVQSLNRIFRATSFLSPGFWARNSLDNTVKNIVQGVTPQTHVDTLKLMAGKLAGVTSEKGVTYSGSMLEGLMQKWGITSGSAFRDGVGDFLSAGKRLTMSQVMSSPRQLSLKFSAQVAEDMLHGVSKFGEKGENFTRGALFMQRLKEGYTPEMAAREVTKYLFDYSRNSPATDSMRFFFPFIQHPIKTLMVAPELIGKGPVVYDTLHNTFPHVLAAAFHDPVTQDQLNRLMPENLRARDAIAGPLIPGNTLLGDLFTNPKTPGKMGSLMYFDPAVGMRVLNMLNVFSKEAGVSNYGLAPIFGAAFRAISGRDNFGRDLDESTVGNYDWANRFNYFVSSTIEGTVAFHNAWGVIKHAYGIGDPKYYEPATVSLMKGMVGHFGGITNLDKDFFMRSIALAHERAELIKNLRVEVGREVRNTVPGSIASYVKRTFGDIAPELPQKTYMNLQAKVAEIQGRDAAQAGVTKQLTSADYAARIKAIDQALAGANKAYQFSIKRYLEISQGARSPQEARAKAGVGR